MFVNKIKTLKKSVHSVFDIKEQLKLIRLALGRIEARQTKAAICPEDAEFQVFSQWGEDGIIQWLINNISISSEIFIEFGTQNYLESDTRFLLMHDNWAGLIIDGSKENMDFVRQDPIYWQYNIKAVQQFITAENINDIFKENGVTGKIGLLSVDIDGNDYWVWKAIDCVEPDIVICEYNPRFGKERAVTIPYDATWTRFKVHHSGIYYGASIKALTQLANEKGYALVAGNKHAANLFFVKRELLNDVVKEKSIDEVYHKNQYEDSRNERGELQRLSFDEEQKIIWSLPLVDVEKGK